MANMFWEKWIPAKYLVKSSVCGIEIVLKETGPQYYYTLMDYKSNKLHVSEMGSCLSFEELPVVIKKNKTPLVICISGKGLVIKKIENVADNSVDEIISQNFPAAGNGDFLLQLYRQTNNTAYLAVLRRDTFNQITSGISESKHEVAEVFLGPSSLSSVMPLSLKYNFVHTNAYSVNLNNNAIESIIAIDSETGSIELDGITLPSSSLMAFASGFIYLTNQTVYETPNQELKQFKKKHVDKNKLKLFSYTLVSIAFIICISNVLFFSNYFNKNRLLDTEINLYEGKYEQINELLSDYEKKKGLLEQTGLSDYSSFSKYTDKIAATIPDEVLLREWIINPVKKDNEEDSLIVFEKNSFLIRGNCNKSLIINEWVNVLKAQNFIKDVNLEKFSFNSEGYVPNFEIKIQID